MQERCRMSSEKDSGKKPAGLMGVWFCFSFWLAEEARKARVAQIAETRAALRGLGAIQRLHNNEYSR